MCEVIQKINKGLNMQAFHNDIKIQELYLNRIHAHAKADEIIKGKYWQEGKGCAVGCTVHSSNHSAYETEIGVPTWLARLEDRIFEGIPNERAKTFPVEFLEAINLGADLNKIKIPMLIFIAETARECTEDKKSLKAIDGVLIELKKDVLDLDKLSEARRAAAYGSAYAGYDAADAGCAAADVAYAAYSAADSACAGYDAADADADAYAACAASKTFVKFADKLLELIRGCK